MPSLKTKVQHDQLSNLTLDTGVQKDATTAWAAATGTAARTALASASTIAAFTVSNPPTNVEVQAIGDALVLAVARVVALEQHLVALINDLISNDTLRGP